MPTLKSGTPVRLIQPEIRGIVKQRRVHPETEEDEVLVEWQEQGQPVQRWIDADLVEPLPEQPAPEEPAA